MSYCTRDNCQWWRLTINDSPVMLRVERGLVVQCEPPDRGLCGAAIEHVQETAIQRGYELVRVYD